MCAYVWVCVCVWLCLCVCVCACVTLISQISGEIPALPMLWPSCVIGTLHHGRKSGGISIILDLLPSTELWCSLANPRHHRNPILCLSTISCYTLLHANKFLIPTNATILICMSLMTYQCIDRSISLSNYQILLTWDCYYECNYNLHYLNLLLCTWLNKFKGAVDNFHNSANFSHTHPLQTPHSQPNFSKPKHIELIF